MSHSTSSFRANYLEPELAHRIWRACYAQCKERVGCVRMSPLQSMVQSSHVELRGFKVQFVSLQIRTINQKNLSHPDYLVSPK